MAWRFAQISDVHLGAKLAEFEPPVADALRQAVREAVAACFQKAFELDCVAVLIPGDLFDVRPGNAAVELRYVYELASSFPRIKFLIAPGNTDAFGTGCPYVQVPAPPNVHVFGTRGWSTVDVNGVRIAGHAIYGGEGSPQLDWAEIPVPEPRQPAILMLHGTLRGADDSRQKRLNVLPFSVDDLQLAGYAYAALGHLHARIELKREGGRIMAAYAGPPQCTAWDAEGPGGYYTGELQMGGADLTFHPTAQYFFKTRAVELPKPYARSYRARLDDARQQLVDGLAARDILRVSISGEAPESLKPVVEEWLQVASQAVFHLVPPDLTELAYFKGVDPLALPEDSLLSDFLKRCSAEEAQSGGDPVVFDLVRRIGWLMFTGRGLPAEIDQ